MRGTRRDGGFQEQEVEYKQERPSWCPHTDCVFRRRVLDSACAGVLPEIADETDEAGRHINDSRICLNETHSADDAKVFDLKVNETDLDWLRWLFDSLDGKATAWLSKRASP